LATLTSIAQPTIARIESGKEDPRLTTLVRLLAECGEELRPIATRGVGVDRTMIRELLRMTPAERLEMLQQEAASLGSLVRRAGMSRAI